jgi:hypothetical protein
MALVRSHLTNGVSYGLKYTVTATDVSDGYVLVDFQADVDLSTIIQVVNLNGIVVDFTAGKVTYPANGQVKIWSNSTFALEAGQKLFVIANVNAGSWYTYSA